MTVDQESIGFAEAVGQKAGAGFVGMHPLQQAAMRISDFREGRSRLKAKDLVGLLLCHGARAWRSSQPATSLRLKVSSAVGCAAVRIKFQKA